MEKARDMKVILLKELKGRGGEGDVVDVAQGYAVNYLLPQGIAIEATKGELKQLEQRRHNIEKRELARTTDANVLKNALDGKTVKVYARVGEEGQLFGSITTAMLARGDSPSSSASRSTARRLTWARLSRRPASTSSPSRCIVTSRPRLRSTS